jgi:hypothetical protein
MNVASLLKKQGISISRYFSNAGKNECLLKISVKMILFEYHVIFQCWEKMSFSIRWRKIEFQKISLKLFLLLKGDS